jgi:hypothetical protein
MRLRSRKIAANATTVTVATGLLGQLVLVATGVFAARLLGAEDRGYLALIALVPAALAQVGARAKATPSTPQRAAKGASSWELPR